ncbi:MAG: DNA-processing protein DprA [Nitrospirota bacterium]
MRLYEIEPLMPAARDWPVILTQRLSDSAPTKLQTIGSAALLRTWKTALFCSSRTPGAAILRAYDTARQLRDQGITVISGFHSPIEKECLNILLRGTQPVIVCPARSLTDIRLPQVWKKAVEASRMLILSAFHDAPPRVTVDYATRRNEFVAPLAEEVFIAHTAPGSKTEKLQKRIEEWGIPLIK